MICTENDRKAMQLVHKIGAGAVFMNPRSRSPLPHIRAGNARDPGGGDDGKDGMLEFTQTRLGIQSW